MIKDHIDFIKRSAESIEVSGVRIFEGKVFEKYPDFGMIEPNIPCVCIRHNGGVPSDEAGYGYKKNYSAYNRVFKSVKEERWSYDVDFWVKDIEKVFIDEDNFFDLAREVFYSADFFLTPLGEKIFFNIAELGGVSDPEDLSGISKMVIKLEFIEKVYRSNDVPLLPDNIELEVEI